MAIRTGLEGRIGAMPRRMNHAAVTDGGREFKLAIRRAGRRMADRAIVDGLADYTDQLVDAVLPGMIAAIASRQPAWERQAAWEWANTDWDWAYEDWKREND